MTVSFYHLCASMRACVHAGVLVFVEGVHRYFYCGCAPETITLLSYTSRVRKAFYSYLTPGAVARSVACKLRIRSYDRSSRPAILSWEVMVE